MAPAGVAKRSGGWYKEGAAAQRAGKSPGQSVDPAVVAVTIYAGVLGIDLDGVPLGRSLPS